MKICLNFFLVSCLNKFRNPTKLFNLALSSALPFFKLVGWMVSAPGRRSNKGMKINSRGVMW